VKPKIRRLTMAKISEAVDDGSSLVVVLAESRFNTDPEGWSSRGDGTLTYSPTDGNPGGCLKAVDRRTGTTYFYVAPNKFLGNKHDADRLEFDIKWVSAGAPYEHERGVEIIGGGVALNYHLGPPPRDVWNHFSIPLGINSSGWYNTTANRPATDDDWAAALASLSTLRIRGEYADRGPETGYLDNVVMYGTAVPVHEAPE
jgi:hypothetical protein